MENQETYETEPDSELIEQRCPYCSMLFGVEVERDGKTLLQVGDLELYRLHGWHDCPATGQREQVHWDSGEVLLRRIVKRKRNRK
jgi:hypothetical protein